MDVHLEIECDDAVWDDSDGEFWEEITEPGVYVNVNDVNDVMLVFEENGGHQPVFYVNRGENSVETMNHDSAWDGSVWRRVEDVDVTLILG